MAKLYNLGKCDCFVWIQQKFSEKSDFFEPNIRVFYPQIAERLNCRKNFNRSIKITVQFDI